MDALCCGRHCCVVVCTTQGKHTLECPMKTSSMFTASQGNRTECLQMYCSIIVVVLCVCVWAGEDLDHRSENVREPETR